MLPMHALVVVEAGDEREETFAPFGQCGPLRDAQVLHLATLSAARRKSGQRPKGAAIRVHDADPQMPLARATDAQTLPRYAAREQH